MDKVLKVIACVNCNYSKIGNCGECDYFSVHVYILQANQKKSEAKERPTKKYTNEINFCPLGILDFVIQSQLYFCVQKKKLI